MAVGVIRPLRLNEIDTRIVIACLDHPIAFAVAGDFDGYCKGSGYITFRAATDLLLSIGILAEQGNGIAAAAFAEAEEIALGNILKISVIGTKPDIRIVVAGWCKGFPYPKLPFHRLILADGQGKVGRALAFRVELKLLVGVHYILLHRSRPCGVLGKVAVGEVVGDLGEKGEGKQKQYEQYFFHGRIIF